MKMVTKIIQDDIVRLEKDSFIKPENAIALARDNGISGRIEIHHYLTVGKEELPYAIYVIDHRNQHISAVFPHGQLNVENT